MEGLYRERLYIVCSMNYEPTTNQKQDINYQLSIVYCFTIPS